MSLDGLSRYEEFFRDPAVGLSLGDQDEDLALARCQFRERVARSGRATSSSTSEGSTTVPPAATRLERCEELVDVAIRSLSR